VIKKLYNWEPDSFPFSLHIREFIALLYAIYVIMRKPETDTNIDGTLNLLLLIDL